MRYTYLIIDLASVILPLIFSFHPKLNFYKSWKAFWPATIMSALAFIFWDIYYTQEAVWGFNPDYLSGIYVFNLPLEEILFFICIPYSCVFTYHCLNVLIQRDLLSHYAKSITNGLSVALLLTGIFFFHKMYTGPTFVALALLLLSLTYIWKVSWFGRFYLMYSVILIPFFIVNGILTGSFLEAPIVWYDDSQNLGLRMFTIPVEDTFYGMLLILLNISLYERFKSSMNLVKY